MRASKNTKFLKTNRKVIYFVAILSEDALKTRLISVKCWQMAEKLATLMSELPTFQEKTVFGLRQPINIAAYLLNLCYLFRNLMRTLKDNKIYDI